MSATPRAVWRRRPWQKWRGRRGRRGEFPRTQWERPGRGHGCIPGGFGAAPLVLAAGCVRGCLLLCSCSRLDQHDDNGPSSARRDKPATSATRACVGAATTQAPPMTPSLPSLQRAAAQQPPRQPGEIEPSAPPCRRAHPRARAARHRPHDHEARAHVAHVYSADATVRA